MGTSKYSDEFRRDAAQQITARGHPVREVLRRLGVIRTRSTSGLGCLACCRFRGQQVNLA